MHEHSKKNIHSLSESTIYEGIRCVSGLLEEFLGSRAVSFEGTQASLHTHL